MEFVGTYYHSIDEKGRVSVPKKFREGLKEGSIVTKGLDGCLFVYSSEYWSELSTKLRSLPITSKSARDFQRLMTYNATLVQFDELGRTHFPTPLAESANLKKEVVFVGTLTRIEIWDKQTYHTYFESLEKRELELTKSIQELGI